MVFVYPCIASYASCIGPHLVCLKLGPCWPELELQGCPCKISEEVPGLQAATDSQHNATACTVHGHIVAWPVVTARPLGHQNVRQGDACGGGGGQGAWFGVLGYLGESPHTPSPHPGEVLATTVPAK